MEDSFLNLVAKDVLGRLTGRLKNCVVIFPNKRPIAYFLDALVQYGVPAEEVPTFYSIEDFINELATTKQVENIDLLFILYKLYLKHYPESDFDEFFGWGNLMLSDFDDIDRYLVDADKLLKNVSAVKDLEKNFMADVFMPEEFLMPLNPDDEHYLENRFRETWQIYAKTYHDLKAELKKQNLAYAGMNYREVAEKLASGAIKPGADTYIFIGFNALSKAEETIIQTLINQNKALIYWDADRYYIDNEREDSGHFIRKHASQLSGYNPQLFTDQLAKARKNIEIIGVPLHVGQAKALGIELKKHLNQANYGSTAIVLADENLLVPVLYALPEETGMLNITSGYPLQMSSLYGIFQACIHLQDNYQPGHHSFYHKDVLAILSHPIVRQTNDNGAKLLTEAIQLNQLIYISETFINGFDSALLNLFFKEISSTAQIDRWFREILAEMANQVTDLESMENKAFKNFDGIINQLAALSKSQDFELSKKTYLRLFKEKVYLSKIPLSEDHPDGIQLMGMLETRCIDFDTVFILSVNEGILPAGNKHHSYIPFDLRKSFGLPTFDEQDNLYAYYFYRLLQRSSQINLIYNSETGSGGEEKSRYIRQIEYFLPKANPNVMITHRFYSLPLKTQTAGKIIIKKEEAYFNALKAKNKTGISPSFISAYYICPLQFLFNKVMNLPEKEEVVEDLEARHFGLLFHALMERSYEGLKGEMLTKEIIEQRKARLVLDMDWVLDKIHKTQKENILQKNSLLVETVKVLAEKTLEADILHAPFKLIDMEVRADYRMPFHLPGFEQIYLKGIIDRIDEKDGITRIVDYKTGAVKSRDFNFRLPETELMKDNKEAFQTIFYGYLYHHANPGVKLQAAIMPLKEVVKGYIKINENDRPFGSNDFMVFEDKLKSILLTILAPEKPVIQAEDQNICAYCSYNNICMR